MAKNYNHRHNNNINNNNSNSNNKMKIPTKRKIIEIQYILSRYICNVKRLKKIIPAVSTFPYYFDAFMNCNEYCSEACYH